MSTRGLAQALARAVKERIKSEAPHHQPWVISGRQRIARCAWTSYLDAMLAAGLSEALAVKEFRTEYTKQTGQAFLPNT